MKFKGLVAFVFVVFSVGVHADESSKQAKLSELVNVMDMDAMVESMYSQMEVLMQNMSTQMGVQASEQATFDKYYSQMITLLQDELSWEKMEPSVVDIYNRNFSEKEIDDMLAFYKTETGQSLLTKMPVVMQESMQMSQALMQSAIPKIQAIAQELSADLEKARATESE